MKKASALFCLFFALCSCAPKFDYASLHSSMSTGNYPGAIQLLKDSKSAYGSKAAILHMLDSGMVSFACGDPKDACLFFQEAHDLAQNLWTTSITSEASSLIINDFTIAYRGEDYERALINLFSAFCFIKQGQYEEAMVDCRKLDTVLNEYNSKYKKKNVYKEDALGQYISGVLCEIDNEYSEAYIYYYESLKAFKSYAASYGTVTPQCLFQDILRVSAPADKKSEAKKLVPKSKGLTFIDHKAAKKMGKIVFIHLNGKAPEKIEKKFTTVTPTGPISIAFPEYATSPPSCHSSKLVLKSNTKTIVENAALFENINAIAVKDLADRKGRVMAKTIARAITKQAVVATASKMVEKKYGALPGLIANVSGKAAASALEKADTRSWRTLPGEIYVARTFVNAGSYQVSMESCTKGKKTLDPVTVKAGETKFVFCDTMY